MSSFESAYEFILTFHHNHGPISYRFRDKTAISATLKELLSQATPPTSMLQYGFLLTTLDILELRSKFYLIFDVCSDSENDSYVMIITGVLAQRYAIA